MSFESLQQYILGEILWACLYLHLDRSRIQWRRDGYKNLYPLLYQAQWQGLSSLPRETAGWLDSSADKEAALHQPKSRILRVVQGPGAREKGRLSDSPPHLLNQKLCFTFPSWFTSMLKFEKHSSKRRTRWEPHTVIFTRYLLFQSSSANTVPLALRAVLWVCSTKKDSALF